MLTWQLDRLLRAGPLCALLTFVIPSGLAALVAATSGVDNVLGIVLLAALVMFVGAVAGSTVMTGLGAMLFGVGTVVAEVPAWVPLVVGCGLFATLVLHDVANTLRRAPRTNRSLWTNALTVILAVSAASAALYGVTYLIATLATWQSIVVPFGIAAIGFAAKLAADAHATAAKQLTAKRKT